MRSPCRYPPPHLPRVVTPLPPLFPPPSLAVIAKVFRQADTEESGNVPTAVVPSLAAKVLGAAIKESDMQLIRFWVEQKEGMDGRGGKRRG